jgi:hypothetical protein
MTIRRGSTPPGPIVALQGFAHGFAPGQIANGVQQGDMRVEIGADEIAAAGWTAPPRNPDRVTMDARTWTVLDARPLYDGAELLGFSLWIRGA